MLIRIQLFLSQRSLFITRTLLSLSILLVGLLSGLAFAQADAGTDENFVAGTVGVVQDTAHSIRQIAGDTKSPKVLIVLVVLMGLAQLIRRVGRKLPLIKGFDVGAWLNSHWWADWVVSLTLSIGGAIVTQVTGGGSIDTGLIVNAIVLGMAGAGFGPKATPPAIGPAVAAGEAAAKDPGSQLNS